MERVYVKISPYTNTELPVPPTVFGIFIWICSFGIMLLFSMLIVSSGFCWRWKSQIMEGEVMDDLANLCEMLEGVNTQPTRNGFRFNLSADGSYQQRLLMR